MSVAAATGAVSTQHHQPTAEQIRLANLIDDKKHDQPEVQAIVRKVLDVVANSTQEDALVALYDCDYDYERTVALLIEKGHDIASEWRTATNHKTNKKQQQKTAASKNGHGGETDENGQVRGTGKARNGRSRYPQQQDGGDSQSNQPQNDNYISQQRQRGGTNNRGRFRGNNRGGQRTNDRNYQQQSEQQPQDSNVDNSLPSDTTQRLTDTTSTNRRGGGGAGGSTRQQEPQPQPQPWDVGNWNGETMVYSRTSKDDEQRSNLDNNNVSNAPPRVSNGQFSSLGSSSNVNNVSELNTQKSLKSEFDPVEAARQIKNVIGIGQSQQQNTSPPKPLMDIKPLMGDQQTGQQQQRSNIVSSKSTSQNLNTKVTPPPPQRIPHQPVIFSDRFDGGMNKIDVQFGSLSETFDDAASKNASVKIPSSSSSAFHQHSEPSTSVTKQNNNLSSVHNTQRPIPQYPTTEQSAFVSPTTHTNPTRSAEQQQQQPVMNQQRVLSQQQQQSMSMKPVVPPQYAVHHQQHPMNAQNMVLQSLFYHQQQPESIPLDTSYDPTAFQLPSIDFNSPYIMAAMNQQSQQTQPRYLVTQPPPQQQQQQQSQPQQQTTSNRQSSSGNVPTPSLSTSSSSTVPPSSTSTTSSTGPKKGPTVPPGIFIPSAPAAQPGYSAAYSTNYGVLPSLGGQQQTGGATYPTPYDTEHLFSNAFMQLNNHQQTQSPSGAYGSVTPPVQQQNQQQQQTHNSNDNKTMNYRNPFNENLLLLQQYQQIAIQQSNNQQQGQQGGHSSAPINFFLGHTGSGPSYSPGPPIMFTQPTTAMSQHQQQVAKQQGQQYNQNNSSSSSTIGGNDDYYNRSSSSNKDARYMYNVQGQPQEVSSQSSGQQQGQNKQQRGYNNQQHSFQ